MSGKKSSHSFDEKRRRLLKFLGLGSAIFLSKPGSTQIRVNPTRPTKEITDLKLAPRFISINVLRQFDLLSLELRYYNFTLSGNTLQKKGNPAYVVVVFQPQSMSEQAWKEEQNSIESPTIPGRMLIGGESRLVFSIPANISSIPLDVKELLAWEKYDLVVNERAKQPSSGRVIIKPVANPKIEKIQKTINNVSKIKNIIAGRGITKDERQIINREIVPEERNSRADAILNVRDNITALIKDPVGPLTELETSLEIPMRLYLSPTSIAGWSHIRKLNADKGILKDTNRLFELWHTRMGTKTKNGNVDESSLTNEQRILRAMWADDAKPKHTDPVIPKADNYLGLTSMSNKDRHRIVHESSNYQIPRFVPQPIKAFKLFLTTLGAWLDSELLVDRNKLLTAEVLYGGDNNALNLLKWRHIETLGREHYVEIVEAGNIMPFGHEAVLIKITERKPHTGTGTAANFQRMIVVITETVKDYNYRDSKGEFMNFSFSKVEMITTTSPLLDFNKKKLVEAADMAATDQFVIRSENKDVPFKIKAEDLDGNFVDFIIPLAFISTNVLGSATNRTKLVDAYNAGFKISNNSNLKGQKFTLAPQVKNGNDTTYVAQEISFGAKTYTNANEPQGFLPVLKQANIIEPSYQRLTGIAQPVSVSLEDDNNKGHVFAKFNFAQAVNFAGQSDKTGGMATPNFNLSGLSKLAGAFGGDISKFKTAAASADDFFSVSNIPDPKLFGVFKLSEILNFVSGDASSYDIAKPLMDRVPKIPNLTTEETADEYITSYVIKPKLKNIDLGFVQFIQKGGSSFSIVTQARVKKKNPTGVPSFGTDATLTAFKIGILKGLINIDFNKISFVTEAGKKADVSVEMANPCVVFGGALAFINNINSLIPSDGFSDPPYLDVSLTGIKCGYSLAIPNVQMGVFSLSNMTLGAEVNLPFTGAPLTFGFNFCTREQPFCLTVSFLGGGGFFGMEIDLQGIRMIEASLEFGAAVSINLGVASGGVSIMAGIYFKMELVDGQNSTTLTGYVRINGSLCILGLITASIELYMALTYLIDKEKAYGEATLKMKIEILFFSASVTLHTQRTFKGSGKDPNFQMAIKENEWLEYCAAFAA
ncbi:MAG: hypothetical protein KAY50_07165 [Chitinophagaceae bacterium]|nr:hypothetical protein [Chitinophagaceae bacterium]